MSAVKHAPATPLPFHEYAPYLDGASDKHYRCIEGGPGYHDKTGGKGFHFTAWCEPQDAAYIVNAANAYPKLVAALNLAYANLDDKAAREEIGALLLELGE